MGRASTAYLRRHDWGWYSDLVNKCSNPFCVSKKPLEVHHIQPLYCSGKDSMDNCVVLCTECHRHLKLHSEWEYYQVVILNWKMKADKDILNKMPQKYRKSIIDAGLVVNYKLLNLSESLEAVRDKEEAYQNLLINRNRLRALEHDNSLNAYNQMCADYEFFHNMLNGQVLSVFYGSNLV